MYLYILYGIVKVEAYSHNKGEYFVYIYVTFCLIYHLSEQRLGNPKTSIVYCSAPIQVKNIHDPIPLDKSKDHTALLYITWRLIWDLKIKTGRSQLSNSLPDCSLRFQKGKKKSLNLLLLDAGPHISKVSKIR